MRRALLLSLGASPLPESAEFILAVITEESGELAASAITAMAANHFRTEMKERTAAAVERKHDPALQRVFEKEFRRKE